MAQQLVDQLLKKMSERHADAFIRLTFPDANFRVVATSLEKELIFKTKIVDTDEILSGKKEYRLFIPSLLELSPKPSEDILIQQRQLIHQEEDLSKKKELISFSLALATRYFNFEFLKEFFKEDVSMFDELMQVPYIGEKIKRAMSEGREKGMKEGMRKGMKEGLKSGMQQGIRDNIIEVLENRFKAVNGIKDMISSIEDIEQLRKIFRLSLTIESFETFRDTIAKMKNN